MNKNGIYYAFLRDRLAAGPVWQDQIGTGGPTPQNGTADIAPSAWDGSRLYVAGGATVIRGQICKGSLRAVVPRTGGNAWQDCLTAPVLGGVLAIPGVVEVGSGSRLIAVSDTTGRVLFRRRFSGAKFWGAGSVSDGTLYQGSMSGTLFALSPSGRF